MQTWHLGPTQAPAECSRIRCYTRHQHWAPSTAPLWHTMHVSSEWKSLASLPILPLHHLRSPDLWQLQLHVPSMLRANTASASLVSLSQTASSCTYKYPLPHLLSFLPATSPTGHCYPSEAGSWVLRPKWGQPAEKEEPGEPYIVFFYHSPPPAMLFVGRQLFPFAPSHCIPCT